MKHMLNKNIFYDNKAELSKNFSEKNFKKERK